MTNELVVKQDAWLDVRGTISFTGWQVPEDTTPEEWEGVLLTAGKLSRGSSWVIGDALVHMDHKWGEKYDLAQELTGLGNGYLRNLKLVAEAVDLSFRNDKLSIMHHMSIAKFRDDPDLQAHWLNEAEANHWSVRQLREALGEKDYPLVAANHAETEGDDWCTPIEYVDAVREVLGTIDLDPATNEYGQSIIGASKFYTKQDDGLAHEWHGRVFLNPPYSVPMIDKFASKLLAEYITGNVTEAIVLTNNSTETQWFQGLLSVCQVVCFPSRRLKFWKNGNEVFATRQGQAFFYFGTSDKFSKVFATFGTVLGKYDDH